MKAYASHRFEWIDIGKAISIILIVIHHLVGVKIAPMMPVWLAELNNALLPYRIPTFFLLSGMLVPDMRRLDLRTLLQRRIIPLFYLYVLWQFLFAMLFLASDILHGKDYASVQAIVGMFWKPLDVLWFIYALVVFNLVLWLLRSIPDGGTLVIGFVAFFLTAYGNVNMVPFAEKLPRLFLWFCLGHVFRDRIFQLAAHVRVWHLIFVPFWFSLAYALFRGGGEDAGPLTHLLVSGLALPLLLIVCVNLERSRRALPLVRIGRETLVIYLLHFPMISLAVFVASRVVPSPIIWLGTGLVFGIAGPLLLARLARGSGLGWLFKCPARIADIATVQRADLFR